MTAVRGAFAVSTIMERGGSLMVQRWTFSAIFRGVLLSVSALPWWFGCLLAWHSQATYRSFELLHPLGNSNL